MSRGDAQLPDEMAAGLYSGVICDILDDLGHREHAMIPEIRFPDPAAVVVGVANPFLVEEVAELPAVPYRGEIAALDDLRPGEVVLLAAAGSAGAALWRELFSTAAQPQTRARKEAA